MANYKKIEIKNKKASFEYHLLQTFESGIVLSGTEVKSIREGKANINEAYCHFDKNGELWIKNMHISEYKLGTYYNHETKRDRKLLLKKSELKKLQRKVNEKGLTIVPTKVYFNERGLVKIEIALAQGKRAFDKRHSIKDKDMKREESRINKWNKY
ncbi:MAG TPA: SsrA-binding protein SmpB [Bacteroidetes bacterium]|jgi:SsrA-binding protein|nr:SsrA-binding protein SmpB [Bacteroidota bacterium]